MTFPPYCAISAMTLGILKIGHAFFGLHQMEISHGGLECIPARLRNCLFTVHARQGKKTFAEKGEYVFCYVCLVHQIWINCFIIIYTIYDFSSAQSSVCLNAKPLSHFPTCQNEPTLESQQLIWVKLNCSKCCTIHVAISKLIVRWIKFD